LETLHDARCVQENSLKCNHCGGIYHGGITRIKYHLGKVPKCGVVTCKKVPRDVTEEMLKLMSKKLDKKDLKNKEKEEDRAEVDLSHSEGEEEEHSDTQGNSVIVLKKVTSKGSSSGGPMDKYCKLTPEEILAARKGRSSVVEKVQSKLSTEKREEKRDRACEYICQFFCNLAKWWLNHGSSAPNLRKLAARILSLTCSSSACERCWSSYEQVSMHLT
jgi:hypothetical protein